jgi:hypothetical protein
MYAFELPAAIPPAGASGGPPVVPVYNLSAGMPASWIDARSIFLRCVLDPQQLPVVMHEFVKQSTWGQGQKQK